MRKQQGFQHRLSVLDRPPAKVLAVEFEKIECVQQRLRLLARAVAQSIEDGQRAIVVEHHHLAVYDAGLARQRLHGGRDRGIAPVQSKPFRVIK